jgi:hypothetical protein
MIIDKEQLLSELVEMFLEPSYADRGYFNVFRELKRLKCEGIVIEMDEVQRVAYDCDREVE